eukprot:10620236-Heterocapsa_arctica.AAC.1
MVLIVCGFPCRDLCRPKSDGPSKRNKLFHHLPRILDLVEEAVEVPVRFLAEWVVCNDPTIKEISKELGVKPLRISALPLSATMRDR